MTELVHFHGDLTLIDIDFGVTTLNAKENIYSAWKRWAVQGDNLKYLQAFTTVGGDDLGGGVSLGAYFFLENGWFLRPHAADHRLIVNGNLFTRDGSNPFAPTDGDFTVIVDMRTSSLTQQVSTGGGSLTAGQVWADPKALTVGKFLALK